MEGRPTLYQEEYCVQLIDHMSKGLSYETFAAKLGTCRQTLYNWEKEHPEFLDTKKRAMEVCQLWWEMAGVNGLYTIVEHGEDGPTIIEKKINQAMWIFNMKARFRWQDQEPKEPDKLSERQVLTLEDKKRLLIQGEQELKKLREELEKVNG
jgi:DNA-binding XRE family transcriptional regulator